MKCPKLYAAIDEALAKMVHDNGETVLLTLIEMASAAAKPVEEKLPPIPTTKEEVAHAD